MPWQKMCATNQFWRKMTTSWNKRVTKFTTLLFLSLATIYLSKPIELLIQTRTKRRVLLLQQTQHYLRQVESLKRITVWKSPSTHGGKKLIIAIDLLLPPWNRSPILLSQSRRRSLMCSSRLLATRRCVKTSAWRTRSSKMNSYRYHILIKVKLKRLIILWTKLYLRRELSH